MNIRNDSDGAFAPALQGSSWRNPAIPPQPCQPAPLRLVVHPSGATLPVHGTEAIVGRHSRADIRLPLPDVSRHHCRIVYSRGQWNIIDLDSLNGLHVNGARVKQARLTHRDVIRIGGCLLEVDLRTGSPTVALPITPGGGNKDPLYSIAGAMAAAEYREAA